MTLAQLLAPNFTATRFRLVTREGVAGGAPLHIDPAVLRQLAFEAFRDINFFFRTSHLEGWASILDDGAASDNDRYVAAALLANAAISAEGVFPSCQDTGTATIIGLKGEGVAVGADDETALVEGVRDAYARCNLRASQVAPVSIFDDTPTGTNLPAQVDLHAAGIDGPGGRGYRLLFVAKGGGSANKTVFSQENRTLLEDAAFEAFLRRRVTSLGVAGCPPYHLAVVVGGTSAERNLEILKLATAGALDHLGDIAAAAGRDVRADPGALFRDRAWEARLLAIARETTLGAQFGGAFLALDARVVRLPRHAASLPVSVGVSCSAHRNALARIDADGAWLEEFDRDPARFLPKAIAVLERAAGAARHVDLDAPLREVRAQALGAEARHPRAPRRADGGRPGRGARAVRPHAARHRRPARLPARPRRLLRGPGADARGARHRQLRAHHRAAHGRVRAAVHGAGRVARDARQGKPLARGLRRVP